MYTVIGGARSRTFRVLWALEELGLDYDHQPAGPRSDLATQHNPLGKIPVLLDGDQAIFDSMAIVTFLADKHDGLTAKAGTTERAQQDAMTNWLIDEFDAALWMMAKHKFVLPQDQRVPEIFDSLKTDFAKKVDVFSGMIKGEFVMGDQMTIPDILAVHCLNWSIGAKMPYDNDVVDGYARRLRAREAFKTVKAIDPA